jgi:putative ABC transport system permease protein
MILVLYVKDELSYDKHHVDGELIFRITSAFSFEDYKPVPRTSPPIAWGIKDEIPEFEIVARIVSPVGVTQSLIRYDDTQFYEEGGYVADSTLSDLLTYEFIEGNPKKALTQPNSIIISEKLSQKLFGSQAALNKVIQISQGGPAADFRITGVYRNDHNSHINANFITSINSSGWSEYVRREDVIDEWAGQNFMFSYVKLKPGYNFEAVINKMNDAFEKHGAADLKALGMKKRLGLEAVKDSHLYSTTENPTARITYLYVVASIAFFILLIACINFMNLSTAKATKRALEVGLRKTLGAQRGLLIRQFLSETMVIVLVAMVLSFILMQVTLPAFNDLTGKKIQLDQTNVSFIAVASLAITLVTGLLAGSYPAFYLSSFKPSHILKGQSVLMSTNGLLRKSLVVFQFVIAITLVCGMIVVTRQLRYMQEQNLGFNQKHKLVLPLRTKQARDNYVALRDALSTMPSVNAVTATDRVPGDMIFSDFGLYPGGSSMEKAVLIRTNFVEPNFLNVMGIKVIAGQNFPETRNGESWRKLIVNREAAKQLGFTPDQIVGELLYFDWQGQRYDFEVIGVMENFHQTSLKEKIFPMLYRVNEKPQQSFAIVDVEGTQIDKTIASLQEVWTNVNQDTPFEYNFLDERIQKQYVEDRKVSVVINTFTIVAMIISCLGLYGLSTYMAEKRFKEIGVRKVLGASVSQIVAMMSSEFVKLVVVAFVIAVPLSVYCMNKWLEGFAYRINPDVMIYLLAGIIAFAIALLTISFESLKAASGNPVKALRNE